MDFERLRERIREIARNQRNVQFEELCSLLDNHVGPLFPNYNHHGNPHHAFTLGHRTFVIARPHHGPVKIPYVRNFLHAMEEVGLYDPEEARGQEEGDA